MFRKAERKKAKLRLGITGTSGSGKTWSSLAIATGIGGKIAMIDTESGRGELYGEDFEYDVMRIEAPYSPEKYINAIKTAEQAGYDILIIDSFSHAWAGEGGILSIVDRAGSKSFSEGWKTGTPKHNALVDAIITSKLHIIVTMRSKAEYAIEKDDRGKIVPKKIGMAPIQRDGLEYEFTLFINMSQDHVAHFSKDNTKLFDQQYIIPDIEMGRKLIEWLNIGTDPAEYFKKTTLPDILDSIYKINNLNELRYYFEEIHKKYSDLYPIDFQQIIKAKDEKKIEIENKIKEITRATELAKELGLSYEVA